MRIAAAFYIIYDFLPFGRPVADTSILIARVHLFTASSRVGDKTTAFRMRFARTFQRGCRVSAHLCISTDGIV